MATDEGDSYTPETRAISTEIVKINVDHTDPPELHVPQVVLVSCPLSKMERFFVFFFLTPIGAGTTFVLSV